MRFIRSNILRFSSRQDGVAAIEVAIILPILLLIYLATYEISKLYSVTQRVTKIANAIGNLVAQETTITRQNLEDLHYLAQAMMFPYDDDAKKLSIAVSGYWIDEHAKTSIEWNWPANQVISDEMPLSIKDRQTFIIRSAVSTQYRFARFVSKTMTVPIEKIYYYRQRLAEKVKCSNCSKT
ncbi:MAG: pilus assembly protein [Candidatus Liberibacter ctenarytainae]|uniref:Pilus assembly protein n=1 Tax=Candidatus Liberibacter ctenarytainae TaxID=2020335 RepID=A0A937ABU4_9HYPH|nr:pilus assembly protein [Candidatus Liberibacter ctenarytainae]